MVEGSGTVLMLTLSKRQLPELLFKAVPWVLTSVCAGRCVHHFNRKVRIVSRAGVGDRRGQSGEPVLTGWCTVDQADCR